MAERRMFAKSIITSDAFLDMPPTARCLYFSLGMFADDDGFVNNPKSIMRQVGATVDDMNILVTKKFVLVFDSGVIVIKHWRIHNYIRKDTYRKTNYKEELAMLSLDENDAYTLGNPMPATARIESVTSPSRTRDESLTQDRIGEDRTGKDRIGQDRIGKDTLERIAKMYNDICVSLPKCQSLGEKRCKHLRARLKEFSEEQFEMVFTKAEASDFLTGKVNNFKASFDWFIKSENNMSKVLEGNYDNKDASKSTSRKSFLDMME